MTVRTILTLCAVLVASIVSSPLANVNATTPAPPRPSCTRGLVASADVASLARRDDGPPYSAEQIRAFVPVAETAFKTAADGLCASGAIDAKQFAKYRRLLVRSGSGADDSVVYDDEDAEGPPTLVFEWVFSEEGLKVPDRADIEAALRCWSHWNDEVCSAREP